MSFFKSIACCSALLLLAGCSDKQSVQEYISNAEIQIVDKQHNEAIISLKNALKVDSKNARARFLLGRLYLAQGDAESAQKELEIADKLKYDINKVLPLLARSYMLTESDDDLLALSRKEKTLTAISTQYLAYKTMAALRTGDEKRAKKAVEKSKTLLSNDAYSMLANAYLEFSKQNIEHAKTIVERIILATPDNVDALMLQGKIASIENNSALAVKSYENYLVLQPKSGRAQLLLADALLKNGQIEEAEAIADEILARIPTQPFMQYIKAMARFESKDYETANYLAGQSLSSGFSSFRLKLVAGASAFYLQNYKQCHSHLISLLPYLSKDHPARRMLAISQLELGLIDEISETLNESTAYNKENSQFLTSLTHELLELGAYSKAQEIASHVEKSGSKVISAEQTARAGVLKLMMNDPSGIENLELALQQNPELLSAELALAFASIQSGDIVRASEIADKWLEKYPNKAGGYNLQATILFQQKQLEKGKAALEKSLLIEPNNVYALTELVKLANYQEDTKQALLLTEQALNAHPNNIKVLRQYFSLHKNNDGLKVLIKAHKQNMTNIEVGMLLAEAYLSLELPKDANSVLSAYDTSIKTPKRYWQLLLFVNSKLKDKVDPFTILDSWSKTNPYHIEASLLLVRHWTNNNFPDRALRVIDKAMKQHPKNLTLHLLKMQTLINDKNVIEAKQLLNDLEQFDVNKNLLVGMEGRILLLERKFAEAIPKLNIQYNDNPSGMNAIYLALAFEGNNQKSKAISLLETFSDEGKVEPKVHLLLANMYLTDSQSKAIVEYERLIGIEPENIVALNNLSWLYMEQGEYIKALKYAENAYNLAAKVPNVVDTYAQVLFKSNKIDEAQIKAEEAYELSKRKDIDIALNLAEILLANNKNKESNLILEAVNAISEKQKEKKQMLKNKL